MTRWDRTHEALSRAAMDLFAERGYEATHTAHIAARTGVTEMTLFRHFPSKEALLLDDPFDPLMAEAVRERPSDESAVHAVVGGIRQALEHVDDEVAGALRHRLRIVAQTPSLRGAVERNSETTVAALVDALVDRSVPELQAKVAASAVVAGLGAALLDWARSDHAHLRSALQGALDVLGGQ